MPILYVCPVYISLWWPQYGLPSSWQRTRGNVNSGSHIEPKMKTIHAPAVPKILFIIFGPNLFRHLIRPNYVCSTNNLSKTCLWHKQFVKNVFVAQTICQKTYCGTNNLSKNMLVAQTICQKRVCCTNNLSKMCLWDKHFVKKYVCGTNNLSKTCLWHKQFVKIKFLAQTICQKTCLWHKQFVKI